MKSEVIVVGYGPAAMTTSAILGRQSIATTIVNPFPVCHKMPSATRLLALSLSSIELFKEHKLVKNIKSIGQPIKKSTFHNIKEAGYLSLTLRIFMKKILVIWLMKKSYGTPYILM